MPTYNADGESPVITGTVTITDGTSLSSALDLTKFTLVGLIIPAAWTAAVITFQASADAVTYNPMYDKSGVVELSSVAADQYIACDPATFVGVRAVKVQSGAPGATVNQGQDTVITLVLRAS